ncbi:MAG: putative oxidoreductase [Rhodobacteraceae bacterium HLUCCA12]|nr:MAG: putative oxidoreductase [Rhodobacteraceae bacterium HLUCCA12]
MKQIPLGSTGLSVSEFCLGTMTWGNQTPEADAHRQIDLARDHGVSFLDTAEMYPTNPVRAETAGRTEEIIGSWLAARGGRDQVVIATKVTGKGSDAIAGGAPEIGPARLRAAVEASLARLGTDVIDIYQLHWPNRSSYHFRQNWTYAPPAATERAGIRANMLEVLTEAGRLVEEGKIRHFALSNETAWGMANWIALAEANGLPRPASLQNEYSLLARQFDTDLAELCALEDVPLLAYSPLAAGLLTGKYAGDVVPDGSRRAIREDLGGRITPRVFEAVAGYLGLARDHGLDPVQMALAWCRTRPFSVIPIIGATSVEQLQRELPAASLTLKPEVLKAIDAMHKVIPMPY